MTPVIGGCFAIGDRMAYVFGIEVHRVVQAEDRWLAELDAWCEERKRRDAEERAL